MKKTIFTIACILSLNIFNSCSEDILDLKPPYEETMGDAIKTEDDVNKFLMGTYLKISSSSLYGSNFFFFGDLLGDSFFRSNKNSGGLTGLIMMNYDPTNTGDIDFYRSAYDVIQNANFVINNELEDTSINKQYKAEARALRAITYFNLLTYYSASPKSGLNQDIGVPIAVYPYNPDEKIARSSVSDVYKLIVEDLNYAIENAKAEMTSKIYITKTAAKLMLSRVYLTRQNQGDAQLAYNLTEDIISNSPKSFSPINPDNFESYFALNNDDLAENQPETVWEVDFNTLNNPGVNNSLSVYYSRTGSRKGLLAKEALYNSFASNDVRKILFSTQSIPTEDFPKGVWIRKFERASTGGNYTRNNKILRFSEAYLNRIEALYQLGNNTEALSKLNEFALTRKGNAYSGGNLLQDILTERNKEFFGEGQRFLDLKRYNLPINKGTNCPGNCDVPIGSKYFVFPFSNGQLILNPNAVQHPLWK